MSIEQIKKDIQEHTITWFSDLDDTISTNSTMFYSKLKFLLKIKKMESEKAFDKVLKGFKINKGFLRIMSQHPEKKIYILSRSRDDFIQYFIKKTKPLCEKYNITIIGGKGGIPTEQKRAVLPEGAVFIGDIFEYEKFKDYKHFICVEKYSSFKKWYKTMIKLIRLFIYVINNIGKK